MVRSVQNGDSLAMLTVSRAGFREGDVREELARLKARCEEKDVPWVSLWYIFILTTFFNTNIIIFFSNKIQKNKQTKKGFVS